jgi:hypothetical protein
VSRTDVSAERRIDRWSGGCLIAAGLLLLSTAPHPDVFESTFAEVSLDTPFWVAMHAALLLSAVLSMGGLIGLYAAHHDRLGRLGAVGVALAVVGLVLAACVLYFEAFLMPEVARHDPDLFAWDGPLIASWGVRLSTLAGLWLIGLVVVGFALARSGIVPRPAAWTLAVTAAAFALLEGPFVPVLGPLSTLAFAVGHGWVGAALWSGHTGRVAARTPGRRPRSPVPTGHG